MFLVGGPRGPAYESVFWNCITFLESWIAKFFFAHKLIIHWSLHKRSPSPWIIWGGGRLVQSFFFANKFVVFWKLLIFGAKYNLQTPMELPQTLCSLESLHFSLFGTVSSFSGSFLDQILSKKRQKTRRLAPGARIFCTREGWRKSGNCTLKI